MKEKIRPDKQVPPIFVGKGTPQEGARFNIDIPKMKEELERQGREDRETFFK